MKIRFLMFLLPMVFLVGCVSPKPMSPREKFLSRTANRTAYAKLYEVSPESLHEQEDKILRIKKSFVRGVREAINQGVDINERLTQIENFSELLHSQSLEDIRELELGYNPKTDVILFYHYWVEDDKQDFGYIVSRDGAIKKTVRHRF